MALQASGPISFSQIANEFGLPSGKNLGAYRISQTPTNSNLTLPIDADIPTSGQIRFGNFYSKRLNIVVNCAPTSTIQTRITARTRYDTNTDITVIGGLKGKPPSTSGSKVWIHANGTIGSDVNNTISNTYATTRCSLLVGSWENNTTLNVDVGNAGTITGSGGNGGNGGVANSPSNKTASSGSSGFNGTSALGIDYTNNSVVISNRGRIQEGAGGGGGGGAAWNVNSRSNSSDEIYGSGGSGGGGGRGYPTGSGGGRGTGVTVHGNSGGNGNVTTSGNGGNSNYAERVGGGAGGGGGGGGQGGSGWIDLRDNVGNRYAPGGAGGNGTEDNGGAGGNSAAFGGLDGRQANPDQGGGAGGLNGFAVVVNGDGSNISITGNSLIGNQINNTPPT